MKRRLFLTTLEISAKRLCHNSYFNAAAATFLPVRTRRQVSCVIVGNFPQAKACGYQKWGCDTVSKGGAAAFAALILTGLIIGILVFSSFARADLIVDQRSDRFPEDFSPEPNLFLAETDNEDASAKTNNFVFSGYGEAGKRSTAEDYEEEDTDDDYTYSNYHLKLGQKVSSRLTYDISSFIYDKDYDTKDSLDNISRIFKSKWSYYIRKHKPESSVLASNGQSCKEESLELDVRLNYKEKRYDNTPRREYDQIRLAPTFTFKRKNFYLIDLTAGIDDYDYLEAGEKDQLKIFSKIGAERYFLNRKLLFASSYKIEQLEKKSIDREKTKHEVLGGLDYMFELPWLYKITVRADWGERDTKEEEERDEDFDYEYWQYFTKTEHRISSKLKTNLKYQHFTKNYVCADLDHKGFYIQNGWDYEILDDEKQRVWLDFAFEHKDVDYTLKTGYNYKKETVGLRANYQRKKNLPASASLPSRWQTGQTDWKTSLSAEESCYDFNNSTNDKKRYYTKLSFEKLFLDGDLVLSLDLKYRYTDFEKEDSEEQESVRAGFKYRF